MTCFWIGCNHFSYGLKKIQPGRRLALELVSLVLVLITWCFTIPGIVILRYEGFQHAIMQDLGQLMNVLYAVMEVLQNANPEDGVTLEQENGGKINIKGDSALAGKNVLKAFGSDIFVIYCTIYTIITAIFLVLNLFFRKEYIKLGQKPLPRSSEWVDRKKRDNCCNICTPCNALRMFHHLEHRAGFIIFLVCACLGVNPAFSVPLVLLTFAQVIISYLYAEDIVLCALPLCCVQFLFIRRYPQEEMGGMEHKMEGVLSV